VVGNGDPLLLTPDVEYQVAAEPFQVNLPARPLSGTIYYVVVWYDEDNDGRLRLDRDGVSEFARSPARPFDHDPDPDFRLTMYLSSLAESTEGFGLPWEGIASAVREDENIHHYLG